MLGRKKKFLVIYILLIIIYLFISSCVYAETRQESKIVYVVLDDSGSMNGTRWQHAQYAIEVLTGLLNPGDRMELFYLNRKSDNWTVALDSRDIQNSMHKIISTGYASDGTPFSSVTEAWEKLRFVKEEYDKYWLFVITDGAYLDIPDEKVVRSEFERFVGYSFGADQDKRLQLVYLVIGNDKAAFVINKTARDVSDLERQGIYCYSAGDDKIVEVMGNIADRISGRSRFTGTVLSQPDSNTIRVKSDFPLFNFVVLVQSAEANLTRALFSSGELNIARRAEIEHPIGNNDPGLSGMICTVDNRNSHIPADTYTLQFDKPVSQDQVSVLVEPALEVRLVHALNGNDLKGEPKDIAHVGDAYSVLPEIYEYGTQARIDRSQLPAGTHLEVQIVNGSQRDRSQSGRAQIRMLGKDRVSVTGTLSIPGFTDIVRLYDFIPSDEPVYSVKVNPEKPVVFSESEFKSKGQQIFFFSLLENGKVVNADKYDDLEFTEVNRNYPVNAFRENGKWKVELTYTDGMPLGEYAVMASYHGKEFPGQTAVLDLQPTKYTISVEPNSVNTAQSKLSEGVEFKIVCREGNKTVSPDTLEITITENGNQVPAGMLMIDPASDKTDPKKNIRSIRVTGDITTEAKKYILEVKHVSAGGSITVNEVPLTVTESVYEIVPVTAHQMIFNSPAELQNNRDIYRFDVSVDGRKLTDDEMSRVTRIEVEPSDTTTVSTMHDSGYDVQPLVSPNWTSVDDITYSITCYAPGLSETLNFFYIFEVYEVHCTDGDGQSVSAVDLVHNNTGLSFRIYGTHNNIRRVLPYELVIGNYDVKTNLKLGQWWRPLTLDHTVSRDADGGSTIHVIPKSHSGKIRNLFDRVWPFTPTGNLEITLNFKNESDKGTLWLSPGSLINYWPHLTAMILLVMIIGYITKKRFGRNARMYCCSCSITGNKITGVKRMQKWALTPGLGVLWPFGKDSTTVQGLAVRAADGGIEVKIGGQTIAKEINETLQIGGNVRVSDPVSAEILEKGWHGMRDDDVIAVYRGKYAVMLYWYKSED